MRVCVAYSELRGDVGGSQRRGRLESEHRVVALSSKTLVLENETPSRILLGTYVETSQALAVGVESVVVEINELL